MNISPSKMAYELINATDVEFAEIFAHYFKIRKGKYEDNLEQDDMKFNIQEMLDGIGKSLDEIIYSKSMDSCAWWKDDKFFGKATPKERFLELKENIREGLLMETAMRGQELFFELKEKKLIKPNYERLTYMDIWNDIKELSYKYEYEYYDVDDFIETSDVFFTREFTRLYPLKTVNILVYTSEIISNYTEKRDMIKKYIQIETNRNDLGEFLNCTKDDIASTKGQFQCWLDNYTADDSKGLYAWLVKNGKEFKIIY